MTAENDDLQQVVAELKAEREKQAPARMKWNWFTAGVFFAIVVGVVFFLLVIRPSDQKLLDQVKAIQLQRDDQASELQKAVDQADAVLGTPNDRAAWEKLPLAQRAAIDLGTFQVQIASQRHQLEAYDIYVKTLQNQARMVEADAQWQAVVRSNQQAGAADDRMVTLLNVIRPGLGTVVKKIQTVSRQGAPQ